MSNGEVKPELPPKKLKLQNTTRYSSIPPQSPRGNEFHSFPSPTSPIFSVNPLIENVKTPTTEVPNVLINEMEMPCINENIKNIEGDEDEVVLRKKSEVVKILKKKLRFSLIFFCLEFNGRNGNF